MTTLNNKILIDANYIENRNSYFLINSKPNIFYGKNVFFTERLKGSKYVYFQILGNLGGTANDFDFSVQTDFYIIANDMLNRLKDGIKDDQLEDLESKMNSKGKKYTHLQIISEDTLLNFVESRCLAINDQVTLNLINRVK